MAASWWSIDWRAHQRWVRVQDRWANVVEIGPSTGRPVLFVHGLGGSWRNWLANLPAVAAAGHRAVAVDLPGFGHSQMPPQKISIPAYGRWVDALCAELAISAAAVVGNSMGGFIGAELAIQAPARVERLVLVSAAGISAADQRVDSVLHALHRTETVSAYLSGLVLARAAALSRRARLRRAAMGLVVRHPEQLSAPLAYEQITGTGTPGFLDALDALGDYPIRHRLAEIACPTLIVWGREDRLVPVRDADVFAQLIPDARKVVWDDTGHVAMLERPERFNALVLDFLAEPPGARAAETSGGAASRGD